MIYDKRTGTKDDHRSAMAKLPFEKKLEQLVRMQTLAAALNPKIRAKYGDSIPWGKKEATT